MKIAIIGAGAAGCFAAANIPYKEGQEVAVFEKTSKALQKVKASGGGRCNVTHAHTDITEMSAHYPRGRQLLKKSLHQFPPAKTIEWFEQRGVKLKTEEDGRMFPITDDSQTIIDCIWQQLVSNKAQVFYHKSVEKIEPLPNGKFAIHFADRTVYECDRLLIAVGGFPKKEQYKWIENLGHTIQPPVPSLFTFNMPKHPITELMGVSVPEVTVKIAGTKIMQQGPLLITHWGMSGPAILKTSAIGARELADRNYDFKIIVNWLNETTDNDLKEELLQIRKEQGRQLVHNKNPFNLPKRLWEYMVLQCGIKEDVKWGELSAAAQNKLTEHLLRDIYHVKGKTTFKEEFVTCGGITLSEIDPQTMQSRKMLGLFFAGELLDVDGVTGGYNFQHAWSSGWIAARSIVQ